MQSRTIELDSKPGSTDHRKVTEDSVESVATGLQLAETRGETQMRSILFSLSLCQNMTTADVTFVCGFFCLFLNSVLQTLKVQ